MPSTPISGLEYPVNSQIPDAPAQMQTFLNTIDSGLVSIFTDASVRDARITLPIPGQICYLLDVRHYTIYRDSQWKKITIPQVKRVPPDSISTPLPKWINDTTRSVIPYLTTPVLAGKKYRLEGVLFFVTPAVDHVDASVEFSAPAGSFGMHLKYLSAAETAKAGIHIRRQHAISTSIFTAGIIDKTPVFMDGVFSCTTSGNFTIAAAQATLSAVELRLDAGSYLIAKEF